MSLQYQRVLLWIHALIIYHLIIVFWKSLNKISFSILIKSKQKSYFFFFFFNPIFHPGWCGSVDWVPACEPKGCQFYAQSGHMPGLWASSQ